MPESGTKEQLATFSQGLAQQAFGNGMLVSQAISMHDMQKLVEPTLQYSQRMSLSPAIRQQMEPIFGFKMDNVGIHTDETAKQAAELLEARAFARGKEIYFGEGEDNFRTHEGNALLVHELTHVGQQCLDGSIRRRTPLSFNVSDQNEDQAERISRDWINLVSHSKAKALSIRIETIDVKSVNSSWIKGFETQRLKIILENEVCYYIAQRIVQSQESRDYLCNHNIEISLVDIGDIVFSQQEYRGQINQKLSKICDEIIKKIKAEMENYSFGRHSELFFSKTKNNNRILVKNLKFCKFKDFERAVSEVGIYQIKKGVHSSVLVSYINKQGDHQYFFTELIASASSQNSSSKFSLKQTVEFITNLFSALIVPGFQPKGGEEYINVFNDLAKIHEGLKSGSSSLKNGIPFEEATLFKRILPTNAIDLNEVVKKMRERVEIWRKNPQYYHAWIKTIGSNSNTYAKDVVNYSAGEGTWEDLGLPGEDAMNLVPKVTRRTYINDLGKIEKFHGDFPSPLPVMWRAPKGNEIFKSYYTCEEIRSWIKAASEYHDVPHELLALILQQENGPQATGVQKVLQFGERTLTTFLAIGDKFLWNIIPDKWSGGSSGFANMSRKALREAAQYTERNYKKNPLPGNARFRLLGWDQDTRIPGDDYEADVFYCAAHLRQLIDRVKGRVGYHGPLSLEEIKEICYSYNGNGPKADKYAADAILTLRNAAAGKINLFFYEGK